MISRLLIDYRCAKLLFVAARLDLFTLLSGEGAELGEVARRLRLKVRAARIFLDALVAVGFLTKDGSRYRNTETSERFLVRGRNGFLGDNLKYQDFLWDSWSSLQRVLRRGVSVKPLDIRLGRQPEFVRDYIRGMSDISRGPAEEIARELSPVGPLLLDVGGGPGTYALAFLARNPGLRATILDLPRTLRVTRKLLKASPLRDRIRLEAGDYHRTDLGRLRYDVILLSHVTHNEGERFNRILAKRCYEALRPGGRLMFHDFMTDGTRAFPLYPALFSTHMLVSTREGCAYSWDDYEGWLQKAGFARIRRKAICSRLPNATMMLVGFKA